MKTNNYDFSGYATKHNVQCSDGRIIKPNAFADDDGKSIPLVWNHMHDDPDNILGHALLENREDGVYCYATFNDNPKAQSAKELIKNGDITGLSIMANRLKHDGPNVKHGILREVSLVLAGANPGAYIDNVVLSHADGDTELEDEAIIYSGELIHADVENDEDGFNEATVQDIIDTMSEEQQNIMYALIGAALEHGENLSDDDIDTLIHSMEDILESMDNSSSTAISNVISLAFAHAEEELGIDTDNDEELGIDDENDLVYVLNRETQELEAIDSLELQHYGVRGMRWGRRMRAIGRGSINNLAHPIAARINTISSIKSEPRTLSKVKRALLGNNARDIEDVNDRIQAKTTQKKIIKDLYKNDKKFIELENKINNAKTDKESDDAIVVQNKYLVSKLNSSPLNKTRTGNKITYVSNKRGNGIQIKTTTKKGNETGYYRNKNLAKHSALDEQGGNMKENLFESQANLTGNVITHSELQTLAKDVFNDWKNTGSFKDALLKHMSDYDAFEDVLAHAEDPAYGITNIDLLFPESQAIRNTPDVIKRRTAWVARVLTTVGKTPFSKVKSTTIDITAEEARAKGYIKGNKKEDEVIKAAKRVTHPSTIYKKQRLDRDDIVDLTTFDVVSWIQGEMRMMIEEEIARAAIISDGRATGHPDKISEDNIRPILTDDSLYVIKKVIPAEYTVNDIRKIVTEAFEDYEGTGNPDFYTTLKRTNEFLLAEDKIGRPLYDTKEKVAAALGVSTMQDVPVMKSAPQFTYVDDAEVSHTVIPYGVIVNMADYNFGSTKGGELTTFADFDMDYNQQKYLIETRLSGALTKPKSAIALYLEIATETSEVAG